jgi:hypothetical protein
MGALGPATRSLPSDHALVASGLSAQRRGSCPVRFPWVLAGRRCAPMGALGPATRSLPSGRPLFAGGSGCFLTAREGS